MTIIALRMALDAVHAALTTGARVALALWSPADASRYPADFRFTHGALQPITAPLFHKNNLW